MGLSSSQARLLSLTGRMHDIEYKAQKLEAQKLQMANESAHVYQEYENALNATKIQLKFIDDDGSSKFKDATYSNLLANGYYVQFANSNILWGENGARLEGGKIHITEPILTNYNESKPNEDLFVAKQLGRVPGPVGGVYEIYSAAQLATISGGGNYRLMADIDMTGKSWSPKSFSGTLDGNGHTIKGLNNSLFTTLDGATVQNLNLDVDITSAAVKLGGLAQEAKNSTVKDVNISGHITSTNMTCGLNTNDDGFHHIEGRVGSVIGQTSGTILTNVTSTVDIKQTGAGVMEFGGLVAEGQNIKIENSIYDGDIDVKNTYYTAGLMASGSGSIDNCLAQGSIKCADKKEGSNFGYSAGLVGHFYGDETNQSAISNCKSNMNISSPGVAGAVLSSKNLEISNTYVTGSITSTIPDYAYTAGVVANTANNTRIKNCIVDCDITYQAEKNTTVGLIATYTSDKQITNVNVDKVTADCNVYCVETDSAVTGTQRNTKNNPNITINETHPDEADASVYTACTATGASTQVNETLNSPEAEEQREIFKKIAAGKYYTEDVGESPVGEDKKNDSSYLSNLINAGLLFLFKIDSKTGDEYQVNVATDTNLQEVSDDVDLKKAEAKYEADMRKINQKDKKFDTDLAALESERNAIKTETETLKSVAKDNVDRTFKLFS